jgi:hypothetical protein
MNQGYPSLLSIVDRHKDTLQLMHNHAISKSKQTAKHVYELQFIYSAGKAEI